MKHLTKFNESDYLKIGNTKLINVVEDCDRFLKKYKVSWKNTLSEIKQLCDKCPTPTTKYNFYKIVAYDCEGRYVTGIVGYEIGITKLHAKIRYSLEHGFDYMGGFYGVEQIDIDEEVSNVQKSLQKTRSKLENLYKLKE